MIGNDEELWNNLRKYFVFKIEQVIEKERKKLDKYAENIGGKFVEKEGYTKKGRIIRVVENPHSPFWISPHFLDFTFGINRAVSFYSKILKIETSEDFLSYENTLFYDTIILFVINALKNYLISTFRFLAEGMNASTINKKYLIKFIREFNIERKFLKKLEEYDSLEFLVSELISERIDLQQKKKCKIAFKLLNINLPEINDKIWENIFKNESNGYMQRRHKIAHTTFQSEIHNVNQINVKDEIEYIENVILDVVEFVHDIEWIRLWLRPDPMEINWFQKYISKDFKLSKFQNFKEAIIKAIEKQKREFSKN